MDGPVGEPSRRALDGVRVLDLTHQVAGPSATLVLAFLGADVVKVIAPGSRDSSDAIPFYLNNASKRSLELDLKSPGGLDCAKDLARHADVFVENFGPGVIDRLGLGYDMLRELNPRLTYAQVKGFAADSPYRDYPCFDPIAQALSGGSSITGEPGGLPMKPGRRHAPAPVPARPRRDGHQDLPARGHQPGLPGSPRRKEHPRRPRDVTTAYHPSYG